MVLGHFYCGANVINALIPIANAQSKKCDAESVSISRSGEVATKIIFINQRNQVTLGNERFSASASKARILTKTSIATESLFYV